MKRSGIKLNLRTTDTRRTGIKQAGDVSCVNIMVILKVTPSIKRALTIMIAKRVMTIPLIAIVAIQQQ